MEGNQHETIDWFVEHERKVDEGLKRQGKLTVAKAGRVCRNSHERYTIPNFHQSCILRQNEKEKLSSIFFFNESSTEVTQQGPTCS